VFVEEIQNIGHPLGWVVDGGEMAAILMSVDLRNVDSSL